MDLISDLIIVVDEAGLRIDAYGFINTIFHYTAIILGILHGLKLKLKFVPAVIVVWLERFLAGYLAGAIVFIEEGFVATGKQNGVVVFAFVPLIGFILAKLLKQPYKKIWDVIMVPPLIMFAGARVACTVTGCCRGYPCSWGIYNAVEDEKLFPIQLLESLVTIAILVFVFYREKKNNFVPDGKNVPIILISYGTTRFFLEFLHDNEKIIFGLASTQFHCFIMIFVGIITLTILENSEKNKQLS